MLTLLYVTLMYGGGMPLLYVCAMISFFAIYWVDKITLLRVYKTPPRYNKKLMSASRSWLVPALIIHLIFSFWMFSNSTIFDSEDETLFGHDLGDKSKQIDQDYKWLRIGDRLS